MTDTSPRLSGREFPGPRWTATAKRLLLTRAVLPFLALLLAFDIVLALVLHHGFARCYGVLCLFR